MIDREVSPERSGWRDPDLPAWHHKYGFAYSVADLDGIDLNKRHKEWGWDCPAVDIDKLFIEYDNRLPIALMDYKYRESLKVPEPDRSSANNLVMSRLYTRRTDGFKELPFYVTIYTKHPWTFRPIWINTQAKQLAPRNQLLTEAGFVEWLHWLRDRVVDSSVHSNLDTQVTWELLSSASNFHGSQKRRKNLTPVRTLFNQEPPIQDAWWKEPPV
jgi:hypothetical protein